MTLKAPTATSTARIISSRGKSRLVDCQSVSPVRFLHPYYSEKAVCLILSSFGGGMVQGDQVEMALQLEEHSRLFMGTQANSRVYKNDRNLHTSQLLRGEIGHHALAVSLPEPLVLHEGSRFSQIQQWDVAESASLLLGEWFQCGRSDSGERFAYDRYESLIEIRQEGELLLREPFHSTPETLSPQMNGCFGQANLLLNLYAVGNVQDVLLQALAPWVEDQPAHTQVPPLGQFNDMAAPVTLRSLVTLEHAPITIFRMLGETRMDFDPVWQALEPLLATDEWLGADAKLPMCRQSLR